MQRSEGRKQVPERSNAPWYSSEADVELLHDGGIQRLEVEQEDVLVVEALLWL